MVGHVYVCECGLIMHRCIGGQYNASAEVVGRASGSASGWSTRYVISAALYTQSINSFKSMDRTAVVN